MVAIPRRSRSVESIAREFRRSVCSHAMAARPSAPTDRRPSRAAAGRWLASLLVAAAGACGSRGFAPDFASDNPPQRTAAVEQAIRRHRPQLKAPYTPPMQDPAFRRDVAWLVVMLQSWDPAERLLAIEALAALVGTREGYDPSDPLPERAVAIERWVGWLRGHGFIEGETLPPIGLPAPAFAAAEGSRR